MSLRPTRRLLALTMPTSERLSPAVYRAKAKPRFSRPILIRAIYKSRLEDNLAQQFEQAGLPFDYEKEKLKYEVPARQATYTPDFKIGDIFVEAKGWFQTEDRTKLRMVKQSHPHLDIRLVFQRANSKISKDSKTTYAKWCDDHGFPWADGGAVPLAWIEEAKGCHS